MSVSWGISAGEDRIVEEIFYPGRSFRFERRQKESSGCPSVARTFTERGGVGALSCRRGGHLAKGVFGGEGQAVECLCHPVHSSGERTHSADLHRSGQQSVFHLAGKYIRCCGRPCCRTNW